MKKLILIFQFVLILLLSGCLPSEDLAKKVSPQTYDNGKNVAFIAGNDIGKSIVLIQSWIDSNPTKKIITISSDSAQVYGLQIGWLIIYEDRD